ncbi:MerR family transcriptional regulator [Kineococcus sp. SYSU DK018]|uniref:MerR family transcriptional regulator n=1 Tax=Kineococcus sp. SYSU DK018 TaxID=3383139 RepID=UPI003D7C608C
MRIGQLAERTGVSARSLRYYEQQGLLASTRTPGGQRRYEQWCIERVVLIQQLFAAGLCSSKVAELLPCLSAPPTARTGELLQALLVERRRLDAVVHDAVRAREVLDGVIAAWDR